MASALALLSIARPAAAAGTLEADYRFDGTFTSSVPGAPPLTADGGSLGSGTYSFGLNQGLVFDNAGLTIPNDQYTIIVEFSFDSTSGYRKIVDFQNRTSDAGFYDINTALQLYPSGAGPSGALQNNVNAVVALTRDTAGNVVGYANGVQQFSVSSTSGGQITDVVLRFFEDDFATGQGEASAGSVTRILLYNGPLSSTEVAAVSDLLAQSPDFNFPEDSLVAAATPELDSLLLFGAGAAGMAGYARTRFLGRRRKDYAPHG